MNDFNLVALANEQVNGRNFRQELEKLINTYSRENASDTPDFILAEYLVDCLDSFNAATNRRRTWYGQPEGVNNE